MLDMFLHPRDTPTFGRTLIVGSKLYSDRPDRRKIYEDAVGVDMLPGEGVDFVCDLETGFMPDWIEGFAHIECCSVLEHVRRPWLMTANLEKMMAPGGSIVVRVPFVWRFHGYPHDYWRMSAQGVKSLFVNVEWQTVRYQTKDGESRKPKIIRAEGNSEWFERSEVYMFGRRPA